MRGARSALTLVLAAQVLLGGRYAARTPPWQVPDEPAHYRYAAALAHERRLPVIEPGDYDQERLAALVAGGFPPGASIDDIGYEDYQPPAYYLLAAVPIALADPGAADEERLLAARLVGVLLSVLTTTLAYATAIAIWPRRTALALGAAAFAGFLPMAVAMSASVNNDPAAYALAAALVWLSVGRVTGRFGGRGYAVAAGCAAGLAVWVKATVLPLALLPLVAEVAAVRSAARRSGTGGRAAGTGAPAAGARRSGTGGRAAGTGAPAAGARRSGALDSDAGDDRGARRRRLGGMALAAFGVAFPWVARNAFVYGLGDPLGSRAHDAVVVGQPRTADWIATHGAGDWLLRMVTFTFESFWGVFGWLAVFLDERIYLGLAAATAVAALGLAAVRPRDARERRALAVLALAVSLSVGLYLAYNARYVQHQGRYLLTALVPFAILFAVGASTAAGRVATALRLPVARWADLAALAFGVGLHLLAWLALVRYVVPGLA